MAKRRAGRQSSSLTALVLATYGDMCHLRLPGCTHVATTKDHIIPHSLGGDDSLENFRPACRPCNSKRGNRVMGGEGFGAIVRVVIGPPAGGKTTYIAENATMHDVSIDLDAIARAIMAVVPEQTHTYPAHVRHVAIGARKAAIDRATRLKERVTVWIIHATPSAEDMALYRSMRWQIITCDPGRDVVLERCRRLRPDYIMPAVDKWYAMQAGTTPTLAPSTYDLDTKALKDVAGYVPMTPAQAQVLGTAMATPSREW